MTSLSSDTPAWRAAGTFTVKFYGDIDSQYYVLDDGTRIANTGAEVPYAGYENYFLSRSNLDSSVDRITGATWEHEADENGTHVRYATLSYDELSAMYTATYSTSVPLHETLYNATATYLPSNLGYNITATATYTSAGLTPAQVVVLVSVGVVVLATAVIGILYLVSKKKKEENDNKKSP